MDSHKSVLLQVAGLPVMLVLLACGGGSGGSSTSSGIDSVSVSPPSVSVSIGQTAQFSATVHGTGNFSHSVIWSASAGTITGSGFYSAPAGVPDPSSVTITATSVQDPTKSGNANADVFLITSITISPSSAILDPGQTQQFTVALNGQGVKDQEVSWAVNHLPGGTEQLGSISASGLYTAPTAVPNPDPVTVSAISVADPAKIAEVTVGINGVTGVSISPTTMSLFASQKQTFAAVAAGVGHFNPGVVWSVVGQNGPPAGEITADGVYTAPPEISTQATDIVQATSITDATKSATSNILLYPTPVLTKLTPEVGNVGDTLTVDGSNFGGIATFYFTGLNGVLIPVEAWGSSQQLGVEVPLGATTGPVYLQERFPGASKPSSPSNTLNFTRLPKLRIRAESKDLSAGETTQLKSRVLGFNTGQNVTWTADLGSVDGNGLYQAPSEISIETFAHVSGCISGTQTCDTLILGLHPFRVQPSPALVPWGGSSLQLEATVGGSVVGANWDLNSGGGTLSSNGLYTSSTDIADGGTIPLSANVAANMENASVTVTGAFPGVINTVSDYVDFTTPLPLGTNYEQVTSSGTRLFALGSSTFASYFERTYFFIDIYDITNPGQPVWLDAVEAGARGRMFVRDNILYQIGPDTIEYPANMTAVAAFDISGSIPQLISRSLTPGMAGTYDVSGNLIYAVGPASDGNLFYYQFTLNSGDVAETDLVVLSPAGDGTPPMFNFPTGDGTHLFVGLVIGGNPQWLLAKYDLTASPPALVGTISVPVVAQPTIVGNSLLMGGTVYDISGTLPVPISEVPFVRVVDIQGSQLLTEQAPSGISVIDLSVPSQPKQKNLMYSNSNDAQLTRWAATTLVSPGGGNLSIYDPAPKGGPMLKTFLYGPFDPSLSAVFDQAINNSMLYIAAETDQGNSVPAFDLTMNPVSQVGALNTGTSVPFAVTTLNNTLYVGTDQGLVVVDISNPSNPVQVNSSSGQFGCLGHSGNLVFAGTLDSRLIIFDVTQPNSPVKLSSTTLPTIPVVLRSSGNLLFIADDTAGLLIYNVANPSAPSFVSQFQPSIGVEDIAVSGSLLFLAASDQGLIVVDISNPAKPVLVGQGAFPQYLPSDGPPLASTVALQDSLVYVGTEYANGSILGFDIRQKDYPRLVSMMSEGSMEDTLLFSLLVNKSDLFVGGTLSFPLLQLDITQPRNVVSWPSEPLGLLPKAKSVLKDRSRPWNERGDKTMPRKFSGSPARTCRSQTR